MNFWLPRFDPDGVDQRRMVRAIKRGLMYQVSTWGCQRCGYHEFECGIDLHHMWEDLKTFNYGDEIARLAAARTRRTILDQLEKLQAELDQGVYVLCASCHRAFHAGHLRYVDLGPPATLDIHKAHSWAVLNLDRVRDPVKPNGSLPG